MMRGISVATRNFFRSVTCTAAFLVPLAVAQASTFSIVHSFTGGSDGGSPVFVLTDGKGNIYGSTGPDGHDAGTVFDLASGGTETVLHYFAEGGGGFGPDGLVLDGKGNLWGMACCGGSANGCGVLFKISPRGRETIQHIFAGTPTDGCTPGAAPIVDNSGNIYGTASGGGKFSNGAIFEIASDGSEGLLYSFCRKLDCADGDSPFAGLVMDDVGGLYGTTQGGGTRNCGCGTVYKLAPDGTENVLYKFKGPPGDGSVPDGTLIADQAGNFYGTFRDGGRAGCEANEGCGAVFKVAPDGTETILHYFTGTHGDGGNPIAGMIMDSLENLYGTTYYGGGSCAINVYGCGTVFKLAPDGTETILYSFSKKNGANGAFPVAGLTADGSGNLYGATSGGGASGYGVVFEIAP